MERGYGLWIDDAGKDCEKDDVINHNNVERKSKPGLLEHSFHKKRIKSFLLILSNLIKHGSTALPA
jgi:hypothetical protein